MKLTVFGESYRVLKSKKELKTLDAYVDFENKIIVISKDLIGYEYLHSALHEFFHIIIKRISLDKCELSNDLQEIICDSFATAILENFDICVKKK